MTKFKPSALAFALALALSAGTASADATHGKGHAGMMIGKAGDPARVTRTVTVTMHDNYYEPESLSIKEGETVRFIVKNVGSLVHEFSIATAAMHAAHRPEMMMMVEHGVLAPDRIDMEAAKRMQATMGHGMHDEPNSKLLEPGKSAEMIWHFPNHADLEFACNVPGHYDAGMVGKIKLVH